MDAKELTIVVNKMQTIQDEDHKNVKYLLQELDKQRMIIDDLKFMIKSMER